MSDTLRATEVASPLGMFAAFTGPDGVVRASGLGTAAIVAQKLPEPWAHSPWTVEPVPHIVDALESWLAGDPSALRAVRVEQPGGSFTQRAWESMRQVEPGTVITYGELAARAGNARASQAAGQACARNLLMPFVPCHRIVAGNGLGHYQHGQEAKARFLEIEGALRA